MRNIRRLRIASFFICLSTAIAIPILSSCYPSDLERSTVERPLIVGSRVSPTIVSSQRHALARLAGLSLALPCPAERGQFEASIAFAETASANDNGSLLISMLVTCALPPDWSVAIPGTELSYFGAAGLAPQWTRRGLDDSERRWVTSCVLARLSGTELEIPISLRGPWRVLRADADERTAFNAEDGAFYGDIFGPLDQPLRWNACRAKDHDIAGGGILSLRICAIPDADPTRTRCGLSFSGDCDDACRSVADDGSRKHCRDREGRTFDQVATAFIAP